jgi:murein DD-endopeptidase MepM/ murein hydrolase activator NlpD
LPALAAGLAWLLGCEQVEKVRDGFRDLTPHEAYQESLTAAGLAETALGRDWLQAGRAAVEAPITVSPPFEEQGFIAAEQPGAMAYLVSVPRGRRLTAEVELSGEEGTRVFVDLFRVADEEGDPPRPILSTDSLPGTFVHEPWRGGDFILRLQPELLRGGQYRVTLRLEAQLAFPVEGHNMRSIQSVFGVDRDGGRRSHDGVDIFARRGTPVLAAAPGLAYRIGITGLGGKVVWVRDPLRNVRVYYAHLDSQHVRDGDRIEIGDTVGFVGNTGNARTTPPHLHFGLYRSGEGAVDPIPFLDPPRSTLAELTADLDRLGTWVRILDGAVRLRATPDARGADLRELSEHTAVRDLGGSGEYYRVQLPDGPEWYVVSRLTEPLDLHVASRHALSGEGVRGRPDARAPLVAMVASDSELPVLGRYERYLYVRAPSGQVGWVDTPGEEPTIARATTDTQQ